MCYLFNEFSIFVAMFNFFYFACYFIKNQDQKCLIFYLKQFINMQSNTATKYRYLENKIPGFN